MWKIAQSRVSAAPHAYFLVTTMHSGYCTGLVLHLSMSLCLFWRPIAARGSVHAAHRHKQARHAGQPM
eukprot:364050-Chlamydomonas_euryale.AAC.20